MIDLSQVLLVLHTNSSSRLCDDGWSWYEVIMTVPYWLSPAISDVTTLAHHRIRVQLPHQTYSLLRHI